jgi:hypothetical protein
MWERYYLPSTLDKALALLDRYRHACRIIAGGTDLILELPCEFPMPPGAACALAMTIIARSGSSQSVAP